MMGPYVNVVIKLQVRPVKIENHYFTVHFNES